MTVLNHYVFAGCNYGLSSTITYLQVVIMDAATSFIAYLQVVIMEKKNTSSTAFSQVVKYGQSPHALRIIMLV